MAKILTVKKLPIVLDVLFYSVSAWFLSAGILRYFRMPLSLTVLVASLLALSVGGICAGVSLLRGRKKFLSKAERERKEKLLLHLALEREDRTVALLAKAFEADNKKVSAHEGFLTADGETIVPLFRMQPLSADAVALLLRTYGAEPFTLACNALTPEAEKLLASFGRKAMCEGEVFSLFERTNCTPEHLICGEIPRPKLRERVKVAFSKRNARPFFTGGVLLLAMSFFTVFPLYYLVAGGILLCSAVLVRTVGYD